jgi:hypothetical protein
MTANRLPAYLKFFFFITLVCFSVPLRAQLLASGHYITNVSDSSGQYVMASNFGHVVQHGAIKSDKSQQYPSTINQPYAITDEGTALPENLQEGISKPKQRRLLMAYLKQLTTDNKVSYNKSKVRFYYNMANVFARLRLYPLAMKCFFKTLQYGNTNMAALPADTLPQVAADSVQFTAAYLGINANDDSLLNKQPAVPRVEKSRPISYESIAATFNDGKKAVAYAILFHVKQPVPGKRKIFVLNNTGHTFITLIKYNADSSYVSLSYGFYPKKNNLFSATPIIPSSSSTFKNDSEHPWDEVLGKFISKRRFERILSLTKKYNGMEYHLCRNNCTDFGINAATLAGIEIKDTSGKWPLGSGNNPAVTGESIIEGKFDDTDSGKTSGLFIDWDAAVLK